MPTPQLIAFILLPLAGYLLGSIPFGLLIGFTRGVDIRKAGSGNIGATNLGRVCGKKYFFYAMVLDAAKGFAPTVAAAIFASRAGLPDWTPLVTAVAAFLGHLFPLYLRFKGGKGVATSLGVVLGIWPLYTISGLGALFVFIVVFFGWRYISLASIISAISFVLLVFFFGHYGTPVANLVDVPRPWSDLAPLLLMALAFAALITLRHRANIQRLLAGTEPKFGRKKP